MYSDFKLWCPRCGSPANELILTRCACGLYESCPRCAHTVPQDHRFDICHTAAVVEAELVREDRTA
jgi:hypothetical protein